LVNKLTPLSSISQSLANLLEGLAQHIHFE
jgi:hypothetical protein